MKKLLPIFICTCFAFISAKAQKTITGFVVDAANGAALEFVPIALKHQMIGVVSNEGGKFDLIVPESAANDTILISAFGYKPFIVPVKLIEGPLSIRLQTNITQLQEIEVRPLPPSHYVLMALRRFKQNYPSKAFESTAYYREKITENKNFIAFNEGVFKTYCPNYTDTTRNQDQLMLYRRAENIEEMAFMKKERDRDEKRKEDGKKKKSNVEIDIADSFSGPNDILRSSRIASKSSSYLDSTQLKEYEFTWDKSTYYNNEEVMVINFKSKGKVDHLREIGKLYIERNSLAIVKIENSGDMIIPVLLRPVLFMYGLGVENPSYSKDVSFQHIGEFWYPQQIQFEAHIEVTKRRMFAKNDVSVFDVDQAYVVNKLRIEKAQAIPAEKRYKAGEDLQKQIHNDENLSWDKVNGIKR